MAELLAQAGLRETGAMDDVAQAARDAATVLEASQRHCILESLPGLLMYGKREHYF